MPHPNADRLTLCKLFDGEREHIVLTGAPNLFEFKGNGPLPKPLKVAYAKEGAVIYDGHAEGLVLTTLKTRQDPRRRLLLDGLLRKGTGHLARNTKASSSWTTMPCPARRWWMYWATPSSIVKLLPSYRPLRQHAGPGPRDRRHDRQTRSNCPHCPPVPLAGKADFCRDRDHRTRH